MISQKEFACKNSLSIKKVQLMAEYIDGAYFCPNCKKWMFPEDACAIYIPHKTKYPEQIRIYCRVLDAIQKEMQIHSILSGISEAQCKRAIKNLAKAEIIVPKEDDLSESIDYRDFEIAPKYAMDWLFQNTTSKKQLVFQVLKTLEKLCDVALAYFPSMQESKM